jgi:NTP pyrophosphatase (non-canonical NTP hydrolase)
MTSNNNLTFNDYQRGAATTALYPGRGDKEGIAYTALGLAGEAGEIANKCKKILRGDYPAHNIREDVAAELGDVLWYVAMLADEFGVDMGELAQANLDKLADRAQRNQIKGSGDNR